MKFDVASISLSYSASKEDEPRRPRSLTSAVFERLRSDILTCRLRPGEKLPVAALAQNFEVSLAAVREALSRLVADGLVVAEDQRGFRVSPVSELDLQDLTFTRIEIEGLALRRSIQLGDDVWAADVRRAWEELSAAPYLDPRDLTRHNEAWNVLHNRFHWILVRACGLSWLLRFRGVLLEQSERYRRLARPIGLFSRDAFDEHRAIATAVLSRDADNAVCHLSAHFTRTMELVRAANTEDDA
jgi:DNA-binding GntR family transcriptional regulator